jgi:DNA polymerase III epsilon subunit-like protein
MKKKKTNPLNFQDKLFLIFDTETTGLPSRSKDIRKNPKNWPRLVEIGWILSKGDGTCIEKQSVIIYPDEFEIPNEATLIHGITTLTAKDNGVNILTALTSFCESARKADYYVAHNLSYDIRIILGELIRIQKRQLLPPLQGICTMRSSASFCAVPGKYGKGFKWVSLSYLSTRLFNETRKIDHRALSDAICCADCFHELLRQGIVMETEDITRIFFDEKKKNIR